jgi:uncharacterized protein (UPF0371 family)
LSSQAYLVAKTLRGDNGNLVAYSLVGLEVEGEFGVVSFDDDFRRLLDGLNIELVHAQNLVVCPIEGQSQARAFRPSCERDPC